MGSTIYIDKVIETDDAIVHSRVDGILHITFKEGTEVDPALQDRMMVVYLEICNGIKRPFLYTGIGNVTITKEGREYSKELEDVFPSIATAVIADSLAYKIIANFYLKVNKPISPYKVFNDIASAEAWLKTFL